MKGKGKGSEECPLQFPDVSPVDHVQECPRYTAIAQGDATLSLEDLEPLQLELETLLVSVCERRRRLAHETQLLLSWQEKKIPVAGSGTPSAPGKRSRVSPDGKPSKKFRDGGKVFTGGRPPRKQVASSSSTLATGVTTEEGPSVARNDAPNRFWASLEPYCGQVTAEDVRALEELMRAREEEASEYQRVPPLGRHYAQRWAQEDLQEEQTQGARAAGGGAQGARSPQQTRGSLNCDNTSSGGNNSKGGGGGEPLGSLTQRLVSCLLEENLLCPPLEDNQLGPPLGPSPGLAQQLERRVRRELREHGLLTETDNPDDQVLAELRRCQAELRSVSNRNGAQLNALLRRARESLAQQELNRRLRVADHELLDAWRRLAQARQRKKTPSKKDRDLAAKALRDRQALLKQRPSSLQR